MKNEVVIHIVGVGGVAGIGMTRCLKKIDYDIKDNYYIQGHDNSEWGEIVKECNTEQKPSNMIIPVPDLAVLHYADHPKCYLPSREEIMFCQDKAATADLLGELAPQTYWGRDTHGAGGKGAQLIQEYLPGRNYSCELLYWNGKLLGYFMKERLAYDIKGNKEPLFQRGSSAVSRCIYDRKILKKSILAVSKVAGNFNKKPHGVYSVDLKENSNFEPKITEINAGRFLTASYVFFYMTEYNLPLLMVKTYLNEKYKLGEYPLNQVIIRQVDSEPWIGKI